MSTSRRLTTQSILTGFLVKQLRRAVSDFDHHLNMIRTSSAPGFIYPDYSLETDLAPDNLEHWKALTPWKERKIPFANFGGFSGISNFCFADQSLTYRLFTTKKHEKRTMEGGIYIFPVRDDPAYLNHFDLSRIRVSLRFSSVFSLQMAESLRNSLNCWHNDSLAKVLGENSILGIGPTLRFCGNFVQFTIDASPCGQRTFNWLILSLLNFSYIDKVPKLQAIVFDNLLSLSKYGFLDVDGPSYLEIDV